MPNASDSLSRRAVIAGAARARRGTERRAAGAQSDAMAALVTAAKAEGARRRRRSADRRRARGVRRRLPERVRHPGVVHRAAAASRAERACAPNARRESICSTCSSAAATRRLLTFLPGGWLDKVEPVARRARRRSTNASGKTGTSGTIDDAHTILRVCNSSTPELAINTKFVKPGEVSTWKSLLDPEVARQDRRQGSDAVPAPARR